MDVDSLRKHSALDDADKIIRLPGAAIVNGRCYSKVLHPVVSEHIIRDVYRSRWVGEWEKEEAILFTINRDAE
jgi:hypothetical protein